MQGTLYSMTTDSDPEPVKTDPKVDVMYHFALKYMYTFLDEHPERRQHLLNAMKEIDTIFANREEFAKTCEEIEKSASKIVDYVSDERISPDNACAAVETISSNIILDIIGAMAHSIVSKGEWLKVALNVEESSEQALLQKILHISKSYSPTVSLDKKLYKIFVERKSIVDAALGATRVPDEIYSVVKRLMVIDLDEDIVDDVESTKKVPTLKTMKGYRLAAQREAPWKVVSARVLVASQNIRTSGNLNNVEPILAVIRSIQTEANLLVPGTGMTIDEYCDSAYRRIALEIPREFVSDVLAGVVRSENEYPHAAGLGSAMQKQKKGLPAKDLVLEYNNLGRLWRILLIRDPSPGRQRVWNETLTLGASHTARAVPSAALFHAAHTAPSEALFARFKKCAVDVLAVDASAIVPEASFGIDLNADSLDLVELVMALEEEFGIEVPESDLEGVDTVAKAFALVTSKVQ